jgi:hypothetical protein
MPVVGGASVAISPDLEGFRTKLASEMDAILASLHPTVHVDVDASGFAGLKAKLEAVGETHIRPDVEVEGADEAIAKIEAVKAAEADAGRSSTGGIMGRLLWGAGGALGLASFGSLGSLAGFDPLHAITIAGSLAASAGAGLAGGGLLAAGALGTSAVGLGTDLAGIGQAAGDIRTTETAMTALNQAVMEYGKNSSQAAQAQAQVNLALANFNPVARSAVQSAATAVEGFKTMFDQYTGLAERTGAQIIQQLVGVAEKFLPTIGAFATANMRTIQEGLQPFLGWLQSMQGGLGIFTQLENKFRAQLPTAIHALTQGIELFAHTIEFASERTGAFLVHLDNFLTKVNTPSGLQKWHDEVNRLINDFEMWWNLIKALLRDVYALFHQDTGTASSIVVTLTQMLNSLHQWIVGVGQPIIHTIFEVHKQQILALLALIPPLAHTFFEIYAAVGPTLARLATDLLKIAGAVLGFVANLATAHGPLSAITQPIGEVILGLTALVAVLGKAGALGPIFSGLQSVVQRVLLSMQGGFKVAGTEVSAATGAITKSIQGEGLALIQLREQGAITAEQFTASMTAIQARLTTMGVEGTAAITGLEGAMAGLATSTDAAGVEIVASADATATGVDIALGDTGIGLIIVGLGIAITELATHWKEIWNYIKTGVADAADYATSHINQIRHSLGFIGPILADLILGVQELATHWHSAWHDVVVGVENVAFDIGVAFTKGWDYVVQGTSNAIKAVVGFINQLPGYLGDITDYIEHPFARALNNVSKWWGDFENVIIGFVNDIPGWLDDVVTAIETPFETAINWVSLGFGVLENVVIGVANSMISAFDKVAKGMVDLFKPFLDLGGGLLGKALGFVVGGGIEKRVKDLLRDVKDFQVAPIATVTPTGAGLTPSAPLSRDQLITPVTPTGLGLATTGTPFSGSTLGIDMKAFNAEITAIAKSLHVTTPAFKSITDGMIWLNNAQWDLIHSHKEHKKATDDDTTAVIHHAKTTLTQIATAAAGPVPTYASFAAWQSAMQALDTLIKDQAASQATIKQDQMNLLTAQVQGAQNIQNAQITAANDLVNAASTIQGDLNQMATDATNAFVTHMTDIANLHSDATQAQTQRITNATAIQSGQGSAVVSAINDQTQITVDKMAEYNQSGISLEIARAKVGLDQLKATQDSKDALYQLQQDQMKARGDEAAATAQRHLDQVTLNQDSKVSLAQQKLDSVTTRDARLVAQRQQALDAVTLVQAQKVAAAQNNTDQQLIYAQQKVNSAQAHLDAMVIAHGADSTQAVNATHQLVAITADQTKANSIASAQLVRAQTTQTTAVGTANANLQAAQRQQTKEISEANKALNTATNDRAKALQLAQQHLKAIQDGNALQAAKLDKQIVAYNNAAQIAQAQAKKQIDILTEQNNLMGQLGSGGPHITITNTGDPLEAAAAVAFQLKLAGVH